MIHLTSQTKAISRRFECPFRRGIWVVFAGFLVFVALFTGNSSVNAAPVNPEMKVAPFASKAAPDDIAKIVEKNNAILEIKNELQELLEENGKEARDSEEFLLKMKEFLMLVTGNKLEYLGVLDGRLDAIEAGLDRSKLLTASEVADIRTALEADIAFYETKQAEIALVDSWEDAKALGNEIRTYSEQTLARLRGLAGLRLVNEAMLLSNRAEKISERLEKNVDEFLAARDVESVADSASESASSSSGATFDFEAAEADLKTAILSARANIQTAKAIYLQLIELEGQGDGAKAREALRAAHENLKNARKASLEITIELIKEKLGTKASE